MSDKPENILDDDEPDDEEVRGVIKGFNQTIRLDTQTFRMDGVFGSDSHLSTLFGDAPTRSVAFILRRPHNHIARFGAWLGRLLHRHIAWGLWQLTRYVGTGAVTSKEETQTADNTTEFSIGMDMEGMTLEKQVIGPDWLLDYVQQQWQERKG